MSSPLTYPAFLPYWGRILVSRKNFSFCGSSPLLSYFQLPCWRLRFILNFLKALFQFQAFLQIAQIAFSVCANKVCLFPDVWYIDLRGTFAGVCLLIKHLSWLLPTQGLTSHPFLDVVVWLSTLRGCHSAWWIWYEVPLVCYYFFLVIARSFDSPPAVSRAIALRSTIRLSLSTDPTRYREAPFEYSQLFTPECKLSNGHCSYNILNCERCFSTPQFRNVAFF